MCKLRSFQKVVKYLGSFTVMGNSDDKFPKSFHVEISQFSKLSDKISVPSQYCELTLEVFNAFWPLQSASNTGFRHVGRGSPSDILPYKSFCHLRGETLTHYIQNPVYNDDTNTYKITHVENKSCQPRSLWVRPSHNTARYAQLCMCFGRGEKCECRPCRCCSKATTVYTTLMVNFITFRMC